MFSYKPNFWRFLFCNDEGLSLQLPAVALRVSMTTSWTAKSTQKLKLRGVDFLCWIIQRFRHFSSESFSSLSPYFRPVQSSLFTCRFQSPCFHRDRFKLPGVTFFLCLSNFFECFFISKLFQEDPPLYWWSFQFAPACGSPASVTDHVMSSQI